MPPKPRTAKERERDKQKIVDKALVIIQKHGLDGLTMRKLSSKLKMSSTNIYNYFYNKDEIYLHILINGFEKLQKQQNAKLKDIGEPIKRLRAFLESFADFGFNNPAYYQLMFSTLDPKSMDYVDTPIEALASEEKSIAMRSYEMFFETVGKCLPDYPSDRINIISTRIFCEIHGLINLYHTNIIREIHAEVDPVFENLIEHILSDLNFAVEKYN